MTTSTSAPGWSIWADPPLATALMDRIVDGAIIIKINGKSYRAARAQPTKTTRPG